MDGTTSDIHMTIGRIAVGVVLIIVVLIIWTMSFDAIQDLPLSFLLYFVSITAVVLGWGMLAKYPVRRVIPYLIVIGLWLFLFLLPLLLLPLPPEIPPLAVGFSSLFLILMVGYYGKWRKRKDG